MKCPKCGYVSFDYNQVCPKCNKDITAEQDKLHIPAFRPEPPALLGALVGESSETHTGMHGDSSGGMRFSSGENLQFDDSAAIERGDIEFEDSQEISVGTEPEMPAPSGRLDDFELDAEKGLPDFELGGGENEEISFSADDAVPGDLGSASSDLSAGDLGGDISMDFEGLPGQTSRRTAGESTLEEDLGIDLDALSLGQGRTKKGQEEGEIELDMDGLSNDEMSDIELLTEEPSGDEADDTMEMADLSLDEIQLEESETEALGQEDLLTEADSDEDGMSIDLEDLDLDLDLEDSKPK